MEIIGGFVVGAVLLVIIAGVFALVIWLYRSLVTVSTQVNRDFESGPGAEMNEGDFHSGPGGYSPNTAYPDTFYGSGGNSDTGHDEGDFNR